VGAEAFGFAARPAGEASALAARLTASGRARLPDFASRAAEGLDDRLSRLAWTRLKDEHRDLDHAPLSDPDLAGSLAAAVGALGVGTPEAMRALRHEAGQFGLPPLEGARAGFLLDLASGWRSDFGGLLLFLDAGGRAEGWRPEPGALVLFDANRPPVLTMVAKSAPGPRLSLFGTLG
jgi:hypothetical protein